MPHSGSLAEQAYTQLRDRLVMLDIGPGEPIREAELAADLGIGRTPLREALKRLESEHLVVSYPRRGTFATQVEIADLVDISELRTILEPVAARRAAACQDAQLLRALAELKAQAEAYEKGAAALGPEVRASGSRAGAETRAGTETRAGAGTGTGAGTDGARALLEFDTHVHRAIYAAAGNPHLSETLIRLDSLATRIWCVIAVRLRGVEQHIGEHVGLIAAVLAHDGDRAAALAAEHVSHFEAMVRSALDATGS